MNNLLVFIQGIRIKPYIRKSLKDGIKKMNKDKTKKWFNEILNNNGGNLGDAKRFIFSLTNNTINGDLTYKRFNKELNKLNNIAKALNTKDLFIGYWKNENILYLDLNLSSNNKDDALIIAKKFNQKAIYDLKTNKEIFI